MILINSKKKKKSFTTVGFGDFYPVTFWGKMALTALLICIFVIVPLQTNLIIDAIHSINGKKKKIKKNQKNK